MKDNLNVLRIAFLLFLTFAGEVRAAITSVVVTQASTAIVNQGATDQVLIRIEVNSSTAETVSRFRFEPQGGLATDFPNINIYYTGTNPAFSAVSLFGATVPNPGIGVPINRTGTQAIPAGTVYFWIAADISATAFGGNSIDMEFKNIRTVSGGTTNYGSAINPSGTRLTAASPMVYSSINVFQASSANVYQGINDNAIIGVEIVMTGSTGALLLTDLEFNLGGTTLITDVSGNSNVYYTGSSNSFATGNLFDSNTLPGSVGTWSLFTGSQVLVEGPNYFWFTANVDALATVGNFLDGRCRKATVDGIDRLSGVVQNPATKREIAVASPSPGGISSNLTLWLDAKNGVESGGGSASNLDMVDQWVNKTVNPGLVNLNQINNSRKPIFNDINLNFNPVVTFDGINDKLDETVLGSNVFDSDNNTVVLVHRHRGGIVYFKWEQTTGGNRIGFENQGGKVRFDFPTDAFTNRNVSSFNLDANGQIVSGTTTSGSSTLRNMGIPEAPNSTSGAMNTSYNSLLTIGNNSTDAFPTDIDYAEIIVYKNTLSAVELNKIESYLAIKYGMTLGINGTSLNYNSVNGSIVWDVTLNNGFNYDIGGVSRDDNTVQDQRKSKSINLNGGVSSDILTISNGVDFNNPSPFSSDVSFLVWGHNNAPTINTGVIVNYPTDNGQNIETIFQRHWKSQETGTVNDVVLEFDLSSVVGVGGVLGANDLAFLRLLVDEDGDFTNGATAYAPTSFDNTTNIAYFQHDFTPTNGNDLTPNNGFYFTLGSTNAALTILPVELISFTAKCGLNNQVQFSWTTNSEIDNDYFTIENSLDGINFHEIGTIDGAGNSTSPLDYYFVVEDKNIAGDYFRIKQTDFNGDAELFKTIYANCENSQFEIYPNPFTNQLHLDWAGFEDGFSYEIRDYLGRVVAKENILSSITVIDFDRISSKGVYYIVVFDSNQVKFHMEKLIKI